MPATGTSASHPAAARPSVLVTGGGVRLGAAIVTAFAQAGWRVLCQYRRSGAEAQSLCQGLRDQGLDTTALEGNLTTEAGRQALMSEAHRLAGPLHCLVNNASAFEPDTGATFDPELARAQLEVNLIAPLSLARALAAQNTLAPAAADPACVLHILDQKVFNLNPDYFSYTVSKLALERAVALQAQALAPRVRVCGVAPGLMFPSGPQSEANFDRASRVNLLRRPIAPAEVARTCLFLASTPAITGCTLAVDNGQHLVPLERDVMFLAEPSEPQA